MYGVMYLGGHVRGWGSCIVGACMGGGSYVVGVMVGVMHVGGVPFVLPLTLCRHTRNIRIQLYMHISKAFSLSPPPHPHPHSHLTTCRSSLL